MLEVAKRVRHFSHINPWRAHSVIPTAWGEKFEALRGVVFELFQWYDMVDSSEAVQRRHALNWSRLCDDQSQDLHDSALQVMVTFLWTCIFSTSQTRELFGNKHWNSTTAVWFVKVPVFQLLISLSLSFVSFRLLVSVFQGCLFPTLTT